MFASGAPTGHAQLDVSVQQPGAELGTEKRWRLRHARWICRERGLVDGTTLTYWSTRHVLPTPVALARDGIEQARLDAETHTESQILSVNVCTGGKSLK